MKNEENKKFFSVEGVTESQRILHTPSKFARENLIYVQEVGTLKSLRPHVCRRENIDSFLLILVKNGSGSVTTEDRQYHLQKGDCIFLDCHRKYEHLSSETDPWELMWVHFYGGNSHAYHELFLERNDRLLSFCPETFSQFESILRNLLNLQEGKDIDSEISTSLLLTQLLTECILCTTRKDRIEEVREYINQHYRESSILQDIPSKYNMDGTEIEKAFLSSYGIDLRDYILVRRFTAAKELLRFTIRPLSEVVEESGIRNEDLLRQLFLQNEGMTAEEYRMRWAQWIKG